MGENASLRSADPHQLYVDLLKRCLTNSIYRDERPASEAELEACRRDIEEMRKRYEGVRPPGGSPNEALLDAGPEVLHRFRRRWRAPFHTMTAREGLDNVQYCVESVLESGVPGDLIETGVWRGGVPILMRGILKSRGVEDRIVWAADSFEGLPTPDPVAAPLDAVVHVIFAWEDHFKVGLEEVRENFRRYGLLDDRVGFLKGWFSETLPGAPIERLAVIRLDGDYYESTMDALVHLYPRLSAGGYLIIDDYGHPFDCRRAVDDYRRAHGIREEPKPVNEHIYFWQRAAPGADAVGRRR